jgi:hypothetical protein
MILRLPLAVPTEPRSADSLDKDSLLQNAYIDKDPTETAYVVKRPGMTLEEETVNVEENRGIYFNPNQNKLYYINDFDVPVEIVL